MGNLVRLTLWFWLIGAGVVWSARALGQIQPIPQRIAHLRLDECSPPCWIGIIPGTTTIEMAKARLLTIYVEQAGFMISDSGFADGYVVPNAVENAIEGDDFFLYVRLNIGSLVDGRSETVESIGLFESGLNRSDYALTVADILSTFGAPDGVIVDDVLAGGYEITLKYEGADVVFSTLADRVDFTESPRIYLGKTSFAVAPLTDYRPWRGFGALALK